MCVLACGSAVFVFQSQIVAKKRIHGIVVCVCVFGEGGGSVVLFFAVPRSIPTSDAFFPLTVVCAPTCTASVTGLSHYTESTARVKKAHNPYSMSYSSAPL